MVANPRNPGKPRVAPKPAPISLKEELDAEEALVELAPVERVAAPAVEDDIAPVSSVAKPVVVQAAVAVSVVAPAPASPKPAAASRTELDPGEWPLKTLDLFSENAAAVLELAVALGKAKSVSDAIELQSRFASERYATLVRQTSEFIELTRRATFEASAPVRLSISTFVA